MIYHIIRYAYSPKTLHDELAKYSSQYPSCSQCGTNRLEYLQSLKKEQERIERLKRVERIRQEKLERERLEKERKQKEAEAEKEQDPQKIANDMIREFYYLQPLKSTDDLCRLLNYFVQSNKNIQINFIN